MSQDFDWVLDGELAAMGRPQPLREALEFLKDQDIDVIISLTGTPLKESFIEEFGFQYHHIPIADFHTPTREQVDDFVSIIEAARKTGKRVVVHCLAGKGRTGTMIGCYLVSRGRTASAAIKEIRRLRPGSIETSSQETSIRAYAKRLRESREKDDNGD